MYRLDVFRFESEQGKWWNPVGCSTLFRDWVWPCLIFPDCTFKCPFHFRNITLFTKETRKKVWENAKLSCKVYWPFYHFAHHCKKRGILLETPPLKVKSTVVFFLVSVEFQSGPVLEIDRQKVEGIGRVPPLHLSCWLRGVQRASCITSVIWRLAQTPGDRRQTAGGFFSGIWGGANYASDN